ncbi:PAS domain S-box protein [Natronosalvus rutilus]|uniref:histidine kinase n=1 Tax=Natronosalvus rutilus TaxID=2953753 RepID=A0A9E7N921_9EURY|nr:PAS domain S-box protein [Natronosalvus rutilus]UTF52505.1 PAS domain S-box protein [Natronosalvus rutilus]
MGYFSRGITYIGGQRFIFSLGGVYLAGAIGCALITVGGIRSFDELFTNCVLLGASGIVLISGAYRLPRTDLRPDLYADIASWCVRGIGAMLSIVLFSALTGGVNDLIAGFVVLPALASIAGLGLGYKDARAKTRALDAEDRQRELEQANRKLERANRDLKRYETIVETVNDGIYLVDEDGYFTLVNSAYCEMVGYDREELLGSHGSLVVDEETVETAYDYQEQMVVDEEQEEETLKFEADVHTADGETVRAEASFAIIRDDGDYERVGVVRDVTERNEREQQLTEQNERLDRFAGMLAHELRNPVSIGQIYSRQLPTETKPEVKEYITEAFDRIEDIIDAMLVITRGSDALSEPTPVSVLETAQETWNEVDAPEARMETAANQMIEADSTYLRHLFRNLFENAVKHGGADVTITVGDLPTGFFVADDGVGIPPADRDEIFNEGYTTASTEAGMGLGLTFVKELADVYGWTCSVTKSDTGGARFEFENVTMTQTATD